MMERPLAETTLCMTHIGTSPGAEELRGGTAAATGAGLLGGLAGNRTFVGASANIIRKLEEPYSPGQGYKDLILLQHHTSCSWAGACASVHHGSPAALTRLQPSTKCLQWLYKALTEVQ